jgi:hypothetical protein
MRADLPADSLAKVDTGNIVPDGEGNERYGFFDRWIEPRLDDRNTGGSCRLVAGLKELETTVFNFRHGGWHERTVGRDG